MAAYLCLCGVSAAAEQFSSDAVTQRLASRVLLHGLFQQAREVQGMSAGLLSQGEFYFWRDHGVYLATLEPIVQATTYRTDTTLRWVPGESEPSKLEGRKDKHFRDLLMSIFNFDTEKLSREFAQDWQSSQDGWQLELTPRSFASKRFVHSITLWGALDIEGLDIVSKSGENLRITFFETITLPSLDAQICIEHFAYSAFECDASAQHVSN